MITLSNAPPSEHTRHNFHPYICYITFVKKENILSVNLFGLQMLLILMNRDEQVNLNIQEVCRLLVEVVNHTVPEVALIRKSFLKLMTLNKVKLSTIIIITIIKIMCRSNPVLFVNPLAGVCALLHHLCLH